MPADLDAEPRSKGPAGGAAPLAHLQANQQFHASPGLGAWLDSQKGCLALTTMESGALIFLTGSGSGGILAAGRLFGVPRGMSIDAQRLWITGDTRLFHVANRGAQTVGGIHHDALYVPQRAYFVGDSLLHDVVHAVTLGAERLDVAFVNTNYSVIATVDPDHSFRPLWKPKFIGDLAAEDRCHLNCLCVRDGEIAYASVFSLTDTDQGWRSAGDDAGAIIDVRSQEIVCSGLSKPHSLKWHHDRLWVLNSASGEFGYVDFARCRFVGVAHLGNFLRGLTMAGGYAVVGATAFRGKPFRTEISIPGFETSANAGTASAIYVVDLRTGEIVHMLLMQGVNAVYDIGFVPGVTRPLVAKLGGQEDNRKWTSYAPGAFAELQRAQR
jgi:uncharacterized protein (TIGR03032 family)